MSAGTTALKADLPVGIACLDEEITDGLILAALERAERHSGSSEVWLRVLVEHLGLEPTAPTSRALRPQLDYLRDAGSLRRGEAKGRERWSLTAEGREELARSREAEVVAELPESPQHRAWLEAHGRARTERRRFRQLADAALEEAREIGVGHDDGPSAKYFELAERLRSALWLLGSATHCGTEWPEPDDRFPDIDPNPGPAPGRRAVSAWRALEVKAQGGQQ